MGRASRNSCIGPQHSTEHVVGIRWGSQVGLGADATVRSYAVRGTTRGAGNRAISGWYKVVQNVNFEFAVRQNQILRTMRRRQEWRPQPPDFIVVGVI